MGNQAVKLEKRPQTPLTIQSIESSGAYALSHSGVGMLHSMSDRPSKAAELGTLNKRDVEGPRRGCTKTKSIKVGG